MSSRVQKGNTVFRPLAKARSRTTAPTVSRQPSVIPELLSGPSNTSASFPLPTSSSLPKLPEVDQAGINASVLSETLLQDFQITSPLSTIPESSARGPAKPPLIFSPSVAVPPRPKPAVPIAVGTRPPRPASSIPSIIPVPSPTANPIAQSQSRSRSVAPPSIQVSRLQQAATSVPVPANLSINGSGSSESLNTSSNVPTDPIMTPGDATNSISADPSILDSQTLETAPKSRRRKKSEDGGPKKTKKRRTKSTDLEDTETERERSSSKQPGSRASSSTPRPRKRPPSAPPYDPDANPGEDVDPTTMTMAELCVDTGQGRVSRKAAEILSNHAAWKTQNREKRARMKALMEAKKYGREEEEEEQRQDGTEDDATASQPPTAGPATSPKNNAPNAVDSAADFDYSQDLATSRFNVQVRIGPNGEMVIDEESLVVDRVENDGTENYTHVVESDHSKFVNSGTYSRRFRGSRWSAEETELFYDALSQYGQNYELIAYVLPGRDRKSCKNKFKAEDKKNHARINHCLANSTPVDVKTLSRMTGKDFSGPVPEIRAPPLPPKIAAPEVEEDDAATQNEGPSRPAKRSRSKSQGLNDSDVVVIGDAANFDESSNGA
ncbi:hypothetical protein NLJ89_g7560 [Agrocybe chaxingu]|uniref:Transcription factor TFIIIB component B n=1 Tax=Agrocybe chaxingu TaxID=84603 RepID=A0A9W8JUC5_9AGAR|nr:hypothetical protein NLJ89_g7560 [Agrocybe chaxingu]